MAATVSVSVDQSAVIAGQAVKVTATFVNDATQETIGTVEQVSPEASQGCIDGARVACMGRVLAPSATTVISWPWIMPKSPALQAFTLKYRFFQNTGTYVAPSGDPQVNVQNYYNLTAAQLANYPQPGSLNFSSNSQSQFLGSV